MKDLRRTKRFEKHFKARIAPHKKLVRRFNDRLELFLHGELGSPLFDHGLTGSHAGKRAFSLGGDLRVIYQEFDDHFLFLDVGTHAQVYER